MLRSERAATRVASLRATRALASRRGHLARRKIGVPAFVEALWALVAPDARASGVASPDAVADPPDGAGDAPSAGGGIAVGDPEASPDEAEETDKVEKDDEKATTTTTTHPRRRNVDARSRFHALRALIAIVSASRRGAELLVGGAPTHRAALARPRSTATSRRSRGWCAQLWHMISLKLQTLLRVGAATREKAARLLFLLARTAHGRAALCHEEGANLPDALAAAVEFFAGGAVRVPETEETEEAETEAFSEEAADAEQKRHSPKTRRATREKKIAARVAATCARLLGSLESSRAHDPAFETVAIAADAARPRAATGMYELFFRAPPEVPAAAPPPPARRSRNSSPPTRAPRRRASPRVRSRPSQPRCRPPTGSSATEPQTSRATPPRTLCSRRCSAPDTRTNARRPSRETGPSAVPTPFQTPRRRRRRRVETRE